MATVLVTGATGMLGCSLVPFLKSRGHTVVQHGRHATAQVNADLRNADETLALLHEHRPECIINLIALTNVDACESEPHSAYLTNVVPVANLCRSMQSLGLTSHLVQISSDHVYDGTGPHREQDVNIRNYYAFSKVASEVASIGISSTVLRTNFFGPSRCAGRVSFTDWIYQALQGEKRQPVFGDILFSPLSMATLADMVERVIVHRPRGIFNLGSQEGLSKADFAFAFADALGLSPHNLIRDVSSKLSLKAYRPKDMRMDSTLFEQSMNLKLPTLMDEITTMRSAYFEPA